MAAGEDKSIDFYAVLGLKKECTEVDLKNAYKKLALKWHPDRCSSSGNPRYVEESKKKFQAIQQAYSVLSDANKRFLYDIGVYDCNDDDDENGMGEFLNEMATMMSQTKSDENGEEGSFEELQELFDELFQSDIDDFSCSSHSTAYSSSSSSNGLSPNNLQPSPVQSRGFCMGPGGSSTGAENNRRKNTRKGTRR